MVFFARSYDEHHREWLDKKKEAAERSHYGQVAKNAMWGGLSLAVRTSLRPVTWLFGGKAEGQEQARSPAALEPVQPRQQQFLARENEDRESHKRESSKSGGGMKRVPTGAHGLLGSKSGSMGSGSSKSSGFDLAAMGQDPSTSRSSMDPNRSTPSLATSPMGSAQSATAVGSATGGSGSSSRDRFREEEIFEDSEEEDRKLLSSGKMKN